MDGLAQKTMRGMSSTLGGLAAALHLPAGMMCCGVGAIEAQIAAAGDDESTSDESSAFVCREGKSVVGGSLRSTAQVNMESSVLVNKEGKAKGGDSVRSAGQEPGEGRKVNSKRVRRAEGDEASGASQKESTTSRGGLRGLLSSARSSLGWGKGHREQEDDKSQTSQVSTLSVLSGGLKQLASKGARVLTLRREASNLTEVESEMSSLGETMGAGNTDNTPMKGASLWRHVRMIVNGVRGERSGLAGTVCYRAARRLQGLIRARLACSDVVRQRLAARAAQRYGEKLRLQRRQREAEARKCYRDACREEGKRLFDWSVKCFLQPRAVVDLQRVWRGHRARKRLVAYLKWLADRARRRKEYERYLAALAARRAGEDLNSAQIRRRVWGRVEFSHTGWRPRYDVENPPAMHDHIWVPPRGSSSGVRTLKVLLPPRSERDRRTLIEDTNAWAGIPVGIAKCRPAPERLGPPPRPGTITADRVVLSSVGGDKTTESDEIVTKYSWVPAPLVSKASLLQTPLEDR